jgi:hypothetical protein
MSQLQFEHPLVRIQRQIQSLISSDQIPRRTMRRQPKTTNQLPWCHNKLHQQRSMGNLQWALAKAQSTVPLSEQPAKASGLAKLMAPPCILHRVEEGRDLQ